MDSFTLIMIASLFAIISTTVWLINGMIVQNKDHKITSYIWAFSNTFIVSGMVLYAQREWHPFYYAILANIFLTFGLFLAKFGIDYFFDFKKTIKKELYIFLLFATIFSSYRWYHIELNHPHPKLTFSSSVLFLTLIYISASTSYRLFTISSLKSKIIRFLFTIPFSVLGWLQLYRLIILWFFPAIQVSNMTQSTNNNSVFLSIILLSILGVNSTFAGVIISDLIKKIKKLTVEDFLTKVYNRKYIYEFIEEQNQIFGETRKPYSVILIDLDKFKQINDTYGHSVGDQVLIESAKTFIKNVNNGVVGRIGGEEFCVVLPNTQLDEAVSTAEQLRQNLESLIIDANQANKLNITASFGVSIAQENQSWQNILQQADSAMYKAKENGRNQVFAHTQNK